jgi:hypothetical protein
MVVNESILQGRRLEQVKNSSSINICPFSEQELSSLSIILTCSWSLFKSLTKVKFTSDLRSELPFSNKNSSENNFSAAPKRNYI